MLCAVLEQRPLCQKQFILLSPIEMNGGINFIKIHQIHLKF